MPGLLVHLVELADHVLPPLDTELALLAAELAAHGVDLRLGVSAQTIAPAHNLSGGWLTLKAVNANL